MAVVEGGGSSLVAGVGAEAASPLHVALKPVPYGLLGQYRTSHRTVLLASQAANGRLFELQNPHATNLVLIHRVRVEWQQTAAHTAQILDSIDLYRVTGFSAVDTTGTVTPSVSKMRASMPTTGVNVRGCTVAGVAAGMTGGTLTKDGSPLRQLGLLLQALVPTAGPNVAIDAVWAPDVGAGESPIILAQNEGITIENRVLLGVAAGSALSIDITWSEVTTY